MKIKQPSPSFSNQNSLHKVILPQKKTSPNTQYTPSNISISKNDLSSQEQFDINSLHLIKTNTHKRISSIEEQIIPKQLPKVFISQSSITSRDSKITNDTDSSLVYNKSFSFDEDNMSSVMLDCLVYPANNITVNETQANIEKAQMFIKKVNINEQNQISPIKIILNEDNRTMIVMKNIPLQYKPKEVLTIFLENKYINGRFNFFYLPYNEHKKQNYGFALINFIHPLHIIYFYDIYYKKYPRKFIPKLQKKIDLFYAAFYDDEFNDSFSHVEKEIVLPNKYYDIFKDLYRKSVCVFKEKNFIGEGVFIVKTIGKVI